MPASPRQSRAGQFLAHKLFSNMSWSRPSWGLAGVNVQKYPRPASPPDQVLHAQARNRNTIAPIPCGVRVSSVCSEHRVVYADTTHLMPHNPAARGSMYRHPNRWIVVVSKYLGSAILAVGFSPRADRYRCAPICWRFLCNTQARPRRQTCDTWQQYQTARNGTVSTHRGFPAFCTGWGPMSGLGRFGQYVRYRHHRTAAPHTNDPDRGAGPLFHNRLPQPVPKPDRLAGRLGTDNLPRICPLFAVWM